jgi:capsular polysaccharide transport system permease protein
MTKGIPSTPFSRSLTIQFRIIGALLMREVLTRYGRHNIGFLWMFAEPMMFTLVIAGLWSFLHMGNSDVPIIPFAVTGWSAVILWRSMPSRCSSAIAPNVALMYHRNVKIIDIYASRILLEFFGATMSFAILSICFTVVGWMPFPEDILKIILGWFMLAWFGAALALTVGPMSELFQSFDKIWAPIALLMMPLSGAMFMVEWLPDSAQKLILYVPMVHGVEIIREGYFGSSVRAHYDITYLGTICLCLTLIGLSLTRKISSRVTSE